MRNLRNIAIQHYQDHTEEYLQELMAFINIPSISTDPDKRDEMLKAAQWLENKLLEIGFENATIYPTNGAPVVFGEYQAQIQPCQTLLIYGHYDVQPVDPINLWVSDPFNAHVDGDLLVARGASDMKGQVMAVLAALDSILSNGPLEINIKVIFEGEEEIGSPNLESFIIEHQELLACDIVLNPDTGMMDREIPTITYGLRGIAYYEIRFYGPSRDLHSGAYGGIIHNPAQILCEVISGMHDSTGRVTLPRFYEKVIPLTEVERKELARIPVSDAIYKEQTGVSGFWGEAGYTNIERIGARPTLEVNGLLSGYTGQGSKTVIPSYAMAKISMRLVPDQKSSDIQLSLREYLSKSVPDTVRWELIPLNNGEPSLSPIDTPSVKSMERALETVWNKRPIYKREGGSIPVTALFQNILKSESVLTGFGLPEDNIHSPNEHLHLPTWQRGAETIIHYLINLTESRDIKS